MKKTKRLNTVEVNSGVDVVFYNITLLLFRDAHYTVNTGARKLLQYSMFKNSAVPHFINISA